MVRSALVSVGVGGTAFLLAAVAGFEAFGGDFPSAFYVLPIALLTAVGATVGSFLVLRSRPTRAVLSGLTGVAAFGYAVFSLLLVRYAIAATRPVLSVDVIAVLGVVVAATVVALAWHSESTFGGK